jgi:2-dehydro-3-deoxygluconokinase
MVVALGEALVRFTTQHDEPLATALDYRANVAGSELNVLIAARALGVGARFLTRLPDNDLAKLVRRHARMNGIEVDAVVEPSGRLGAFFLERGAAPRASRILYDRRESAASHLSGTDFDWFDSLKGASFAHSTGITCALASEAASAVMSFLAAARASQVTTSFDVNYRSQLWSADQAALVLREVLEYVDVLFASEGDLRMILDDSVSIAEGAQRVREKYGVTTVVVREREVLAANEFFVRTHVFGPKYAVAEAQGHVIDELGAGDAAAGAFLASSALGEDVEIATTLAARAYARMLTLPGDAWVGDRRDLDTDYRTNRTLVR